MPCRIPHCVSASYRIWPFVTQGTDRPARREATGQQIVAGWHRTDRRGSLRRTDDTILLTKIDLLSPLGAIQ